MYTRASASDYDDFQAKGWTTKELMPLMRKNETYQGLAIILSSMDLMAPSRSPLAITRAP